MEDSKQFILNLVTIVSFILYAIGIYLHVAILGEEWGNIAIDLAIQLLNPLFGVIIVVIIGILILLLTYYFQMSRNTNVFLCWFWIFSLYQCALNAFLQFYGLPDEPINQFFKSWFPSLWYPMKEMFFLIISLILTYIWVIYISKRVFSKSDIILITLAAFLLVGGTLISQLLLMN
ncbi:MAG: hypothetical protein ACTSYB_18645 [Candidatus Helarchaeota archaeon]